MTIFFFLSFLCALAGAGFLFDFILWLSTGTVVPCTIEKMDKGKPVVTFTTTEGKVVREKVQRVTQMGYMLSHAQPGDVFNAIYREGEPPQVRIHGYLHGVIGGFLLVPILAAVAIHYGGTFMQSQISFFVVFAVVVLGGWALLKLIRGNY